MNLTLTFVYGVMYKIVTMVIMSISIHVLFIFAVH